MDDITESLFLYLQYAILAQFRISHTLKSNPGAVRKRRIRSGMAQMVRNQKDYCDSFSSSGFVWRVPHGCFAFSESILCLENDLDRIAFASKRVLL